MPNFMCRFLIVFEECLKSDAKKLIIIDIMNKWRDIDISSKQELTLTLDNVSQIAYAKIRDLCFLIS